MDTREHALYQVEDLIAKDYRSVVVASDPRRFSPGLVAYVRHEFRERDPHWLLLRAEGRRETTDPSPAQGARTRLIWERIRQALGSFFF